MVRQHEGGLEGCEHRVVNHTRPLQHYGKSPVPDQGPVRSTLPFQGSIYRLHQSPTRQ